MDHKTVAQQTMLDLLLPLLQSVGVRYKKFKPVFARLASEAEVISTNTSDGLETINTAQKGDYIVKNQTDAQEEYVLSAEKFEKRYEKMADMDETWSAFSPTGKIIALELDEELLKKLNLDDEFRFIAAWHEPMTAKKGDFLAAPENLSEIYRIARKEFFETYK